MTEPNDPVQIGYIANENSTMRAPPYKNKKYSIYIGTQVKGHKFSNKVEKKSFNFRTICKNI